MSENNQRDSFLYSLNHATVDDIATPDPEIEKKRKAAKTRAMLRYIIMGICVCVFVVSAFSIVKTLYGYKQAEKFYKEMYGE